MFDYNALSFAYGMPKSCAVFKATPDDFKVDETLGFALSGAGEHQFLRIEKRGLNTEEVVARLAISLGKPKKSISYAGLKDRQALTTQWFSVHCPGEIITGVDSLSGDGWRVIESGRHLKKLKTGGLDSNTFTITLRDVTEPDAIEPRLQCLKAAGVPNYFGPQRFGYNGQNLLKADAMLIKGLRVKDRFLRGIYYSAARSFLFNRILSLRVANQTWNKALSGDVMQLVGSHSVFPINKPDEAIRERVMNHDISPTASLWGLGGELMTEEALAIQTEGLKGYEAWCIALEKHALDRAYRAQILNVANVTWSWCDAHLHLSFALTAGGYATSVLRELVRL